jgi:hypothetical protein
MPLTTVVSEMWVHGNAFFPQLIGPNHLGNVEDKAWQDVHGGMRQGPGLVLLTKPNVTNYIHASIPTPRLIQTYSPTPSSQARPTKLFLRITQRTPGPTIEQIFVFDGEINRTQIGPALTDPRNITVVTRRTQAQPYTTTLFSVPLNNIPPIVSGIGISIQLFGEGEIKFNAAGIEFTVDVPAYVRST